IEQGTIERHTFEPNSFDMVCLWDVIEHLPEPRAALVEIRHLLKPSGLLLINYPDIGTWQAKLAGKRFWWLLSVHLSHFAPDSIREICKRAGYEVFHFRRYWQTLEFGYLERMAIHYKMPLAGLLTPADWLTRDKISSIYMNGAFLPYPPSPFSLAGVFGLPAFARMVATYGWARLKSLFGHAEPRTFEEDLESRIGPVLYRILFE